MYIVAIAWLFVVILMAASEAMSGAIVGGFLTFVFYGAAPLALFLYVFGTPQRRRDREKRERAAMLQRNDDAPGDSRADD